MRWELHMCVCMHLKPTPAGINWKIRPKRRRTTTTSTATTWNSFAHKLLGVFGQSINHSNAHRTKQPPTPHTPCFLSFSPGRQADRQQNYKIFLSLLLLLGRLPGLKIRFEMFALILKFISSCDWYRWAKCLPNGLQLPRRLLYSIFIYDIHIRYW